MPPAFDQGFNPKSLGDNPDLHCDNVCFINRDQGCSGYEVTKELEGTGAQLSGTAHAWHALSKGTGNGDGWLASDSLCLSGVIQAPVATRAGCIMYGPSAKGNAMALVQKAGKGVTKSTKIESFPLSSMTFLSGIVMIFKIYYLMF